MFVYYRCVWRSIAVIESTINIVCVLEVCLEEYSYDIERAIDIVCLLHVFRGV